MFNWLRIRAATFRVVVFALVVTGALVPRAAMAAVSLSDIVLDPASASLIPGQTLAYHATGKFSDGSTQDFTSRVVFASRDPKVVSVTAGGLATGVAAGHTEVYASDPATGKSSHVKAQIEVAEITALTISPPTLRLDPGAHAQLHALATFSNGVSGIDVTAALDWSSGKRTVASVAKGADGSVVVTAIKVGSAPITGKDPDSGLKTDKTTGLVTVGGAPPGPKLTSIAIAPASLELTVGDQAPLTATGSYDDGSSADLTATLDWTSKAPEIATVLKNAGAVQVTAVALGSTTIVATDPVSGVKSGSATGLVTVSEAPKLVSIQIVLPGNAVRVGDQMLVTATGRFEGSDEDVDVTSLLDWSTSDKKIAQAVVNADGSVGILGIAAGAAKIKARDPVSQTKAESAKVTAVTTLAKLVVTPATKTIRSGTRSRVNAIGTFEKGFTIDLSRDVQWTSSDPTIASVDTQGRVTGVAAGHATVSAIDPVSGKSSTSGGGDSQIIVVGTLLSIEVTPRVLVLALGEAGALRAGGMFDGEPTSVNLSGKVNWILSDPSKISVNASGGVSCIAQGSSFVTAVDPISGVSSTTSNGDAEVLCGVPIAGLAIEPATLRLKLGKTKKVKAFLSYANGTKLDVTKRVTWTVADPTIVSVGTTDPNIGLLTPLLAGSTTVSIIDTVTGASSTDPGGTSLVVTVPAAP